METELSKKLGVEHAIFGFTPFPAVAAAISRAGGFGVLGAVRYTAPGDLARDLDWMQEHTGGTPYGLDVVMPAKKVEGVSEADVE
ncbi:nitronate monooxygenase, partial [Streptomyces sp. NPDC005180]